MRFSIKQVKIQRLIDKQFPITIKWLFVNITLTDPKIVLVDGSQRLGIKIKAKLTFTATWNFSRDIYIDGEIEYQKHVGELFLINIEVNFLVQYKIAKIVTWPIKKMSVKFINNFMQQTPIYHFNQDDFMHKLAKSRIKDLKIENRSLVLEFKFF